ncbi:DNA-binding protein [Piscinibacter gummiphilus]|uniref:DNA-binding protein n=1 Tax=Piscinibacter gummiphilus TaxID=946333 RepID=A0ABZ0D5G8_9BURK|nr:DNA-binding protein [Piscinibacter gummiphilus]WOB10766.1 DNA-binding protein [Piscinibacter gummiphilus]
MATNCAPPPLDREQRANLPTADAAFHLNRSAQTLRLWACKAIGPIKPVRVHGRLLWPTAELRRVLGIPPIQQ